jgi:hypothetical protein
LRTASRRATITSSPSFAPARPVPRLNLWFARLPAPFKTLGLLRFSFLAEPPTTTLAWYPCPARAKNVGSGNTCRAGNEQFSAAGGETRRGGLTDRKHRKSPSRSDAQANYKNRPERWRRPYIPTYVPSASKPMLLRRTPHVPLE